MTNATTFALLTESVRNAVNKDENLNADYSINWNYVDADAYDECIDLFDNTDTFYVAFDEVCDVIVAEIKDEARAEAMCD